MDEPVPQSGQAASTCRDRARISTSLPSPATSSTTIPARWGTHHLDQLRRRHSRA
ncbi:hypothetical protein [Kibdelosporangium philippinense]|uniref:hypothetical protein n=1 Tax=Kibdelosporangium philippinense TaxID=211113 RepID=UPI00361E650B